MIKRSSNSYSFISLLLLRPFFLFVTSIFANSILESHKPTGVEYLHNFSFSSKTSKFFLEPFTRWDSVYNLNVVSSTYQWCEKDLVFFPLLPNILKIVLQKLLLIGQYYNDGYHRLLNDQEITIIGALLINTISYLLSLPVLYLLFIKWKVPEKVRNLALLCYAFNPVGEMR